MRIDAILRQKLEPAEYRRRQILCGDSAQFQGDERDVMFLSMVDSPPPQPPLSVGVDFVSLDVYEVRVMQQMGGPKLRSAIELVSPANQDRASHRRAFAIKCASYLQQGVAVIIVDVVTERTANLHAVLADILGLAHSLAWCSSSQLYAVAYRPTQAADAQRLEVWPEALAVGAVLPTMPLWLDETLCLPLALEESYQATCAALRIRV